MRKGVRLLRELRHLRASPGPPSLYLGTEEPPPQPSAYDEIHDGTEKRQQRSSAHVEIMSITHTDGATRQQMEVRESVSQNLINDITEDI